MDLYDTGLLDINNYRVEGTAPDTFPVSQLIIAPQQVAPSLDLNFASVKSLDSRITFTRASIGTFINSLGYVETASSGVARFTHDPITKQSLGLLVEESRTNLMLRSQEFGTSPWTPNGSTISVDSFTSPDGTTNADKIVENTANSYHDVGQSVSVTSGTTYTLSVYAKASGRTWFALGIIGQGTTGDVFFDLANGAVGNVKAGVTASIQSVGNGWYRCIVVGAATATTISVYASPRLSNGGTTYTGDGSSGVIIWGAQIEAGGFVSSYIPTTSGTLNRAADVFNMTGTNFSSWYNQTEGTLCTDLRRVTSTVNYRGPAIGTSANAMESNITSSSVTFNIRTVGNPAGDYTISSSPVTVGNRESIAIAYKAEDYAGSYTGAAAVTSSYAYVTSGITQLYLSTNIIGTAQNVILFRVRYFPRRLPNSKLQALTV